MIRGKKAFVIGSIASMVILFSTLMFGLGYYCTGNYLNYNYNYRYYWADLYWALLSTGVGYFAVSALAIAFYDRRILAINIANIVVTCCVYIYAIVVSFMVMRGQLIFSIFLIATAGIAFPIHVWVEGIAFINQKYKGEESELVSAGAPLPIKETNAVAMLKSLKELYDLGLLSEEEYGAKRQQYVDKL